MVLKDTTKDTV